MVNRWRCLAICINSTIVAFEIIPDNYGSIRQLILMTIYIHKQWTINIFAHFVKKKRKEKKTMTGWDNTETEFKILR